MKSLLRVVTSAKLQSFRSLQTYSHHKTLMLEQHELLSMNEKDVIMEQSLRTSDNLLGEHDKLMKMNEMNRNVVKSNFRY